MFYVNWLVINNANISISETESAKEYLKFVEEHFRSTDKPLTTIKFNESHDVQEYIIEMINSVARLNTMGLIDDTFLV